MPSGKEILQSFYENERIYMASPPEKADSSLLAKTLATDVKLYQTPALPYGGTYDGVSGFLKWGQAMASLFDKVDVTPHSIMEDGDHVVVLSDLSLRVRRTSEQFSMPFVQQVKVDREKGVIVEMKPFYWDVQGLNEAVNRGL